GDCPPDLVVRIASCLFHADAMSVQTILLRCYSLYLISTWRVTASSTPILTDLKSKLWDDGPVGSSQFPAGMLFKTRGKHSLESVILPRTPEAGQSTHAHFLSLLSPEPAWGSGSSSQLTTSTESLQQGHGEGYLSATSTSAMTGLVASNQPHTETPMALDKSPDNKILIDIEKWLESDSPIDHFHDRAAGQNIYNRNGPQATAPGQLPTHLSTSDLRRQPTSVDTSAEASRPGSHYLGHMRRFRLPLLRDLQETFKSTYDSHKSGVHSSCKIDPHPYLPIGMAARSRRDQDTASVLRVTRHDAPDQRQTHENWIILHRVLIAAIYKLHEDLMNRLDVVTSVQRRQQKDLIDWLHSQIFQPKDSPPVHGAITPGVAREERELWWQYNKFGFIQQELMRYFSQSETNNGGLSETASKLVETFYAQHKDRYPVSPQPNPEITREILASPEFRANMELLLYSVKRGNNADRYWPSGEPDYNARPFSSTMKHYDPKFLGRYFKDYGHTTFHPKIGISISFPNDSARGILHVVSRKSSLPLLKEDFMDMLKKLIEQMDRYNLIALQQSPSKDGPSDKNREEVLWWLARVILEPDQGLPLFGYVGTDKQIAPWEELKQGSLSCYGQTQLKLIHYFSGDDASSLDLETLAAFLVTIYYHENYPTGFKA
ncbi:hypothetical protein PSTT_09782, partial [Puccinia striiformis]